MQVFTIRPDIGTSTPGSIQTLPQSPIVNGGGASLQPVSPDMVQGSVGSGIGVRTQLPDVPVGDGVATAPDVPFVVAPMPATGP
jgi:hypothetical protein